jgi:hypothetical protein
MPAFSSVALTCAGRGFAMGRSPIQGVLSKSLKRILRFISLFRFGTGPIEEASKRNFERFRSQNVRLSSNLHQLNAATSGNSILN